MSAPEASRMAVKLAASIAVSRRAMRQSSELLAKASMAKTVSSATRKLELMAGIYSMLSTCRPERSEGPHRRLQPA